MLTNTRSNLFCMMLAVAATATSARAASFRGLGNLGDGSPGWPSQVYGISADGTTAVGESDAYNPASVQGFRWTSAGMQGLGDFPGSNYYSYAYGTNADGSVVVGFGTSNSGHEAFRWTSATEMQGLGDLPGGGFDSTAAAVSADGSIVVGYGNASGNYEAFRWTSATGMQGLGDLSGGLTNSGAGDVSADGATIIGTSESATGPTAFRWTDATGMVALGVLPGDSRSFANAISADGSVIVGASQKLVFSDFDNQYHVVKEEAFRWTSSGGMQGLGALAPGTWSGASAVSADGSTIVGGAYGDFDGDFQEEGKLFIWDVNHGMHDLQQIMTNDLGLNLTSWTLTQVIDISADGRTIVGNGTNPSGFAEGWIAVVPEPASLSVVAGTFVLLRRHRRG